MYFVIKICPFSELFHKSHLPTTSIFNIQFVLAYEKLFVNMLDNLLSICNSITRTFRKK